MTPLVAVALLAIAAGALAQTTPMRMPRLIGMTRTQALLTLLKKHTAPRTIRPPDGDGTVLGQSPLPGEPLTAQTDITLDLASLPPPGSAGATMPKVVGLSVDEAVRRLGESRLKINSLKRMDTDAAQPGEIVAQQPSIGAAVTAGIPIDLYVAMPDRANAGAARHGGFSAAPLALAPRATPAPVAHPPPMGRGEPWPLWTLWVGLGSAGLALLAVAALMRGAGGRRRGGVATSRARGSSARLLRAADRAAAPWKNGGGVTREIAAWPPESGLDRFDWRVSVATVESGGPFSTFPGIDRVLTVLDGELALSMDGGKDLTFDPGSEPAFFSGEAAVVANTPAAPVTDLNVMTRRGRASAKVVAWRGSAPPPLAPSYWTLLFSRRDNLKVQAFGDVFHLSKNDALLITGRDTTDIEMESASEFDLFLIFINA